MFEAIDEAYALPFSTSEEYLQETAEAFNKLTDGLLPGCVGALDGFAVKMVVISKFYKQILGLKCNDDSLFMD